MVRITTAAQRDGWWVKFASTTQKFLEVCVLSRVKE
jgi:hypothetical protein